MKEKEKLRNKKMLRNRESFIFLLILCLGVGFAFLSSQLTITGNTSVSGNKWSVYFDNVQITDGSVDASVVPTTTGTTTTSVNYTVLLDKPGDFYEFTIDAVNAGTIDAMIDTITTPNIDSRVLQYVSYSATYEDGTTLAQNDVLKKNKTTTYKVRVEYKKDIEATDLDEDGVNLTLTFGVNYVQSTMSNVIDTEFTKLVKDIAINDKKIDFTNISSETNGKGLYIMNNTKNNDYPIYYYRGAVTNNNAKFAGYCWKIVRTTETGGTKLIYNGTPNVNGQCVNTTETETQLDSVSKFNEIYTSPAYNGYMYGTPYESASTTTLASYVYGNVANYSTETGTYTLSDTRNGVDETHHYTCFSSGTSCTFVNYVYYVDGGTTYYITLTVGKSLDDAFTEMKTNSNDSSVKTAVDNWFNNTFKTYFTNLNKDYNDYLEDTVWCNDRSMNTIDVIPDSWIGSSAVNNGWKPNGGSTGNYLMYSSYGRMKAGTPTVTCSNKNDSFTVTESENGNGALTYPVGLLTTDEINLAGGQLTIENKKYYLYSGHYWWTMSPFGFYGGYATDSIVNSGGNLNYNGANNINGIRPSISLKPGVKIADGGDGSSTTPYEFVVE